MYITLWDRGVVQHIDVCRHTETYTEAQQSKSSPKANT